MTLGQPSRSTVPALSHPPLQKEAANTPSRNQLQFNGCSWGRLGWDRARGSIFIFQGQEPRDRQEMLLINDNGGVPTAQCTEAPWV